MATAHEREVAGLLRLILGTTAITALATVVIAGILFVWEMRIQEMQENLETARENLNTNVEKMRERLSNPQR